MLSPVLRGRTIRLEPLSLEHIDPLASAAAGDREFYQWSFVPRTSDDASRYVQTALEWHRAGTAVPFATVREADNVVIGSTRFFDLEKWSWPAGHVRHGRAHPDVGEIGYTWLAPSAIRTSANTEAKLLMLMLAFEEWGMLRVCFHTDMRNERSRSALERIGARFEGKLRAHRMGTDYLARDSARFSIVAEEWPDAKARLTAKLAAR